MDTGMLWTNDDSLPLAEKITLGAARYVECFRVRPALCLVHPTMLLGGIACTIADINVRPDQDIRPNSFWFDLDLGQGTGQQIDKGSAFRTRRRRNRRRRL